jgi:hypothetical protein
VKAWIVLDLSGDLVVWKCSIGGRNVIMSGRNVVWTEKVSIGMDGGGVACSLDVSGGWRCWGMLSMDGGNVVWRVWVFVCGCSSGLSVGESQFMAGFTCPR